MISVMFTIYMFRYGVDFSAARGPQENQKDTVSVSGRDTSS